MAGSFVSAPSATAAVTDCSPAFSGGSGTVSEPYLISASADLAALQSDQDCWVSAANYYQTADIDMSGVTWSTGIGVATTPFQGGFEGNGHTIDGLAITTSDSTAGLFGSLTGIVANVGFTGDVTSTSNADFSTVGGLVGFLSGPGFIQWSYATGTVSLSSSGQQVRAGGLVGHSRGQVFMSYATGDANSTGSALVAAGGLIGYNDNGIVVHSYSTGAAAAHATSGASPGGLIGDDAVGTVTGSFWDTDASGNATSDGGTGKTTAEMTALDNYAAVPWFISTGWTASWTSMPWGICPAFNGGYPFLNIFHSSDPCTSGSAAALPARARFSFLLPHGQECTSIGPVEVVVNTNVLLPGTDADCVSEPGDVITGWTIPWSDIVLPPGIGVRVVDSQRFTAVLRHPGVMMEYDANVASHDSCKSPGDAAGADLPLPDRTQAIWVSRDTPSSPALADHAPCTPPGHTLTGWNTSGSGTGTPYSPDQALPATWLVDAPNTARFYAVWRPLDASRSPQEGDGTIKRTGQ